jgi:hypothetical protein
LQAIGSRLAGFTPYRTCSGAGLGDQIVRNFGDKNELAVSLGGKKIFNHMNKTTKIILIIIVVGLIVFLGYFLGVKKNSIFSPTPKLPTTITFQETGGGCANIFVYKINDNDTAGISVSARKEKLNLSTTERTFEIGKIDGLNVEILVGEKIRQLYCNDVLYPDQPKPKKLIGKSGQAIISISEIDESQPEWNRNYTATVILKDVHFSEESGNDSDITIGELIFKDIRVGWLPG